MVRMNVIRCAWIVLSLCTLPVAAADWRVAAISTDGSITFVDAASVKRSGDKVAFRLDQRWPVPRSDGSLARSEQVDADCASRSWASTSTSEKGQVRQVMTFKTVAAPGTVYDSMVTAACTGAFRSGAVADRARYAAAFFAAAGSIAMRLDAAAQTQPGYVPPAEPIPVQDPNAFENAATRFSLKKLDAWRFVPLEEAKRNRAELRLGDEKLQKSHDEYDAFLERNAVTRLVAMERQTFAGLKPNLQVSVRPLEPDLPDPSPREVVEEALRGLQKGFPDMVLESPVREFKLAAHTAAEYAATVTVRTKDGRALPMRSRMIVVLGGKFIFFIAMARPPGDNRADEELEKILSSITIGE